jgi:dienelactone hydrolase
MTSTPARREHDVDIPFEGGRLNGIMGVPADATGLVIFAHGSGSGRLSPRNRAVAHAMQEGRLATLIFDLLTERESKDRQLVFDIALLAERLAQAAAWSRSEAGLAGLSLGYFGASTGAAAALVAAATDPSIRAVVSRGGRPYLAGDLLPLVTAPTLLIVGGADDAVLKLNESALRALACVKSLVVVPNATHLFEEAGALEAVSRYAAGWFLKYLPER